MASAQLDELFEALTLIQSDTIKNFPVVLLDGGEWDGMLDWLRTRALADRRIDEHGLAGLHAVSDPAEVVAIVTAARQRAQERRGMR